MQIIANPQLLNQVDRSQFLAGSFTFNDILEELRKPGRDAHDTFVAPVLREGIREFADVEPDMVLEGAVTNVTQLGAFVEIGVHRDDLVDISEHSSCHVKDTNEGSNARQIVKVNVRSADMLGRVTE